MISLGLIIRGVEMHSHALESKRDIEINR